jgi:hypothetical protein
MPVPPSPNTAPSEGSGYSGSCQLPILVSVGSIQKVSALPSAGVTRPQQYRDPCPTPARAAAKCGPADATSARTTLPACRAHYPGESRRVLLSVASPSRAAFPVSKPGRHPQLHFRGPLRLHSRYGPSDCSTAQDGVCREASAQPATLPNRLPATRSSRQLSGWKPPPLVIRAPGAHFEARGASSYISRRRPLHLIHASENICSAVVTAS